MDPDACLDRLTGVAVRRGSAIARVSVGLGLGAGLACGPAVGDGPEVCGREGPVRVLATAPEDEALLAGVLGDRVWLSIDHYLSGAPDEGGLVAPGGVVDVGTCGEDPQERQLGPIAALDSVEQVVLVHRSPSGRDVLEPSTGVVRPVIEETSFRTRLTAQGLVATDGDETLWWVPRPLGTRAPVRIGQDVVPYDFDFLLGDPYFWVSDDTIRYVDTDRRMWRVALPSGDATIEHTDVTRFSTADDGSFVAFLTGSGEVGVIERATGRARTVAPGDVVYATGEWIAFGTDDGAAVHHVATATTYVDGREVLPWAIDDDRLFLYGVAELWTPRTGERTRLDMPELELPRWAHGTFWFHAWVEDESARVLWHVPADGSPRTTVADRVSDWMPLPDAALLLWRMTEDGERALEVWREGELEPVRLDVGVPREIDAGVMLVEEDLLYRISAPGREGWWRTALP